MAAKKNILGLFHFSFNPKKPLGDLTNPKKILGAVGTVAGLGLKIAGVGGSVAAVAGGVSAGVNAAADAVEEAKAAGKGAGAQVLAGAQGAERGVADAVYPWAKYAPWALAAVALWYVTKGRR